jgi:hypothetical protein
MASINDAVLNVEPKISYKGRGKFIIVSEEKKRVVKR